MKNQHLVDRTIFDTTYRGKPEILDQQPLVDEFVKTRMMEVIDEVFDKVSIDSRDPDLIFRIDRLEIDLGEISGNEFRQQMPERLRDKLMVALGKIRFEAENDPLARPGLMDRRHAERTQLFHFLSHGYLPWSL